MDLRTLVLTSARHRLAAFQPSDALEIFAAATPRVTRFMSFDPEPSLEAFAAVWSGWLPRMAAGSDLFLVLRRAESADFLGAAGLQDLAEAEPKAGLWLKEAAQRQGYGSEAVAAMIDWASGATGARAVLWPVVEANRPSRRLAEGLGGRVIGTARLRKGEIEHPEVVYCIPARR
jgi:RimJ/RimL family protein N-acetyltransferase